MIERSHPDEILIGIVSISDRASAGIYEDKGLPALRDWCGSAITTPVKFAERLIPDDRYRIEKTLIELVDDEGCDLVLTTGGTGPARTDVTPEATIAVATREMPGFGEQMRAISLKFVPTAILSRQVAVLREVPGHSALIINLPGQPKAIAETLGGIPAGEGRDAVAGIFAAVPYCIDLIGGPYIETDPAVCRAFRPKAALAARREALEKRQIEASAKEMKSIAAEAKEAGEDGPAKAAESGARPYVDPDPVRIPASGERDVEQPGEPLETIEFERDKNLPAPCAVIWLGRMGGEVKEFSDVPETIRELGGPDARFILVNAPKGSMSSDPGRLTRLWYDLPGRRLTDVEDRERLRASARRISRLIDETAAKGMPRERIFLAGFSQGAAMALYAGLREDLPIAGIISLSGYLPLSQTLPSEMKLGGKATPIFMGHGAYDSVVPLPLAQRSAKVIDACGGTIVWRDYNLEHDFGERELRDVARFMREVLSG